MEPKIVGPDDPLLSHLRKNPYQKRISRKRQKLLEIVQILLELSYNALTNPDRNGELRSQLCAVAKEIRQNDLAPVPKQLMDAISSLKTNTHKRH